MSVRVEVRPELLEWALERSNLPEDTWTTKFKNLDRWLSGDKHPTLKQLEEFAKSTHAPLGYLLLAEPPHEELPIPDFRTVGGGEVARPSVDLLDTIYLAQQRQDWYRDYARAYGETAMQMVGSATISDSVAGAAGQLDDLLGWTEVRRASSPVWEESLRFLRDSGRGRWDPHHDLRDRGDEHPPGTRP